MSRKSTRTIRVAWLGCLAAELLFACDRKSQEQGPGGSTQAAAQAPAAPSVFYCQRAAVAGKDPIPNGSRVCETHPLDESTYGPLFTTPIAYCYTRSMMGFAPPHWEAQTIESCSPTPSECQDDYDQTGRGPGGQPPVKTKCHKVEL